MKNYQTPAALIMGLIITSFLFVLSYSKLIASIRTGQFLAQDKISTLSSEIHNLNDALKISTNNSISQATLKKFDLENKTNFSEQLTKQMLYFPSHKLSTGEQLYRGLERERNDKENEKQRLEKLHVIDFIPPWQLLFTTGLGIIAIRLTNNLTDFALNKIKTRPLQSILWALPLAIVIFVMIYWH